MEKLNDYIVDPCKNMYIDLISKMGEDIVYNSLSREFEAGKVILTLCEGLPSVYLISDGNNLTIQMHILATGTMVTTDITNLDKIKDAIPEVIEKMYDENIII